MADEAASDQPEVTERTEVPVVEAEAPDFEPVVPSETIAAEPTDARAEADTATDAPKAPAVDLAAELQAAEEAAEAEVTEILKGVLDRLGAAHHRPFSRS